MNEMTHIAEAIVIFIAILGCLGILSMVISTTVTEGHHQAGTRRTSINPSQPSAADKERN